ncbi:LOW QUALITY PROTEIN: hypothetical protein ACHAWC_001135 [Mediolabrus comicus]
MLFSNIYFLVFASCFVLLVSPVHGGALSWGQFLGADWLEAEELMRKNVAVSIQNLQTACAPDAKSFCKGNGVMAKKTAVTEWMSTAFERHTYNRFAQVPLGFGDSVDTCLRDECFTYKNGKQRMTAKCSEWIEKAEEQIYIMNRGDDKREGFVIFSTLFATALSCAVGYLLGMYQQEHEDILAFSFERRRESKKILVIIALAIAIPACIILVTCPVLLGLMTVTFFVGRGVQWFIEKKQESVYSAVSGSETSGLVFAAIPVQMD